ncbi:MAG: hypothetical protein WAT92_00205 [Saprospiraceae bacterium]
MTPIQTAYGNLKDGLTPKQSLKPLEAIASLLPKTVYIGKKIHKQEVHDLREKEIKNTMFPELGVSLISGENKGILRKSEAYFFANHKRRLRDVYKSKGKKGVLEYIKWVNENNKSINSAHETTKTMTVVSEIVKEKIKPFL